MYKLKFKPLLLLCLGILFLYSCKDDDSANPVDPGEEFTENGLSAALLDSDQVVDWMNLFLEMERYCDGMRPNVSARAIGYINLAAYEVVAPGMISLKSNDGSLPDFSITNSLGDKQIDWNIALNACYADVMDHFLLNGPANQEAAITLLEANNESAYSSNVSAEQILDSKEWGAHVAETIITYSQTDTEAETQSLDPQPTSYVPPVAPGNWVFTAEPERALYPYWESARTFIVPVEQTTTQAPIPYSVVPSSDYYKEMAVAYISNNDARAEDGEQLWIAEFWGDDVLGLTFGPPSRQISIANQLSTQLDANLQQTLHMYLMLGFALNDAAVSAWKYKYQYMVQRPSAFIHEFIDDTFETNLSRLIPWPNPSFPGYPSGHSTFASAAGGVFIDFLGEEVNFTDNSHIGRTEFKGEPRTFSNFRDMAFENAFSRVPLGVHIEIDCAEGLRLGYEISDLINQYDLEK